MFLLNGRLHSAGKPVLTIRNRGFRYGDALFETLRIARGKILFPQEHFNRLSGSMSMLKMEREEKFSLSSVSRSIHKLMRINRIGAEGRVRLTVFRKEGGLYTPLTPAVSWCLEVEPLSVPAYRMNRRGLALDICKEVRKTIHPLSSLKSASSLTHVMAGIFAAGHHLDECLLLNEEENVSEGISANVFLVRNGMLFTPSLDSACVPGVMRSYVMEISRKSGMDCREENIDAEECGRADEIFFTNVISGIRWAEKFRGKALGNEIARTLLKELNRSIQ